MPVNRPYRRTNRQFTDGSYRHSYTDHPKFAKAPEDHIRAFLLLLKDLQELFDYVEPADNNHSCFSYRIHALLLRVCVEVEANCKAILQENGYSIKRDFNMGHYRMINETHLLSSYQIKIPNWRGKQNVRIPFSAWEIGDKRLSWYQAYNDTKHNRHSAFETANFEHLIDAYCGLLVLLSAQFGTNDFVPRPIPLAMSGPTDGLKTGIGDYFRVKFPESCPSELQYDFDWQKLRSETDPFQEIDYFAIAKSIEKRSHSGKSGKKTSRP